MGIIHETLRGKPEIGQRKESENNRVVAYHLRRDRVEIGQDIPRSIPRDVDVYYPPEVRGIPQVWFTTNLGETPSLGFLLDDAPKVYVHVVSLSRSQVIKDLHTEHWVLTTGQAIVEQVWEMDNRYFGE